MDEKQKFEKKKLDEQLKRGKPKNVKKLYDTWAKQSDPKAAEARLLEVMDEFVSELP